MSNRSTDARTIGIAGAGILGRMLAWRLGQLGHHVSLFDQDDMSDSGCAAAWVAAGMLTPDTELNITSEFRDQLRHALSLWPDTAAQLSLSDHYFQKGCWVISHAQDNGAWQQFLSEAPASHQQTTPAEFLDAQRFTRRCFFPDEASIDAQRVMLRLGQILADHPSVTLYSQHKVTGIKNGQLSGITSEQLPFSQTFDLTIDTRGQQAAIEGIRGVRGEVALLHAPDVQIDTLVRLIHPRYSLYIVPRSGNQYVIGATQLETDDNSPVSVRSALELLSAAYSIDKGFAEARILALKSACRPALPNHEPKQLWQDERTLAVSGLYRHGILLSPLICQQILDSLHTLSTPPHPIAEEVSYA